MKLTQDEQKQVEVGTASSDLLSNPFFQFLMTEMTNAYAAGMFNTKPEEAKEREGFYHGMKALQDIGGTLSHWVQVKEGLMAAMANEEQEVSE